MATFIPALIIGLICIFLGISNMRGNIKSIHSYHRHRVSEEDRIPFGKLVGLGTIIIGASVIILGIFSALTIYTESEIFVFIGTAIMTIGFLIGLGVSFYAMIKYNKGIF